MQQVAAGPAYGPRVDGTQPDCPRYHVVTQLETGERAMSEAAYLPSVLIQAGEQLARWAFAGWQIVGDDWSDSPTPFSATAYKTGPNGRTQVRDLWLMAKVD